MTGRLTAARGARSERGAGLLLWVAGMLLVLVALAAGLGLLTAQIAFHRAQGAADRAVLTAAQARHRGSSEPCEAATAAAAADHVTLVHCGGTGSPDLWVQTVTVSVGVGSAAWGVPLSMQATSHAGPERPF